jgi:hypothetical protein
MNGRDCLHWQLMDGRTHSSHHMHRTRQTYYKCKWQLLLFVCSAHNHFFSEINCNCNYHPKMKGKKTTTTTKNIKKEQNKTTQNKTTTLHITNIATFSEKCFVFSFLILFIICHSSSIIRHIRRTPLAYAWCNVSSLLIYLMSDQYIRYINNELTLHHA